MRVNQRIRVPQVRLIDLDGQQVGVISTKEALMMAEEKGYDLVEISPSAKPPVCKIMDYGKYKYEQNKKERSAKKKQHIVHLKEMHFTPKTEEHDYQFKLKHVRHFLEEGCNVKIVIQFRGRELVHREFGVNLMQRIVKDLADLGAPEQAQKFEGRNMILTLLPKDKT
ncbi:MAG: translation initiation factor IF-3 [candidate division Zixibacteria bacterium]|nr:translation initiation factor IF-3 [candidate division Zixibacteria bacterium]